MKLASYVLEAGHFLRKPQWGGISCAGHYSAFRDQYPILRGLNKNVDALVLKKMFLNFCVIPCLEIIYASQGCQVFFGGKGQIELEKGPKGEKHVNRNQDPRRSRTPERTCPHPSILDNHKHAPIKSNFVRSEFFNFWRFALVAHNILYFQKQLAAFSKVFENTYETYGLLIKSHPCFTNST